MSNPIYMNEDAFLKAQEKGRRKLHTMLLLLTFFLFVYTLSGFIAIQTLLDDKAVVQYCILAGGELLLWVLGIVLLWNGTKAGRIVFPCVFLLSMYAMYCFYQFFQISIEDTIAQLIRLIFLIFYICKSLTMFLCCLRLFQDPIKRVWEMYEKDGSKAEEEDQILIQHLMEENNQELKKKQSRKKIRMRAQHNLRFYTILLTVFLYGSMLLFYFLLFMIRYYFPSDGNGIDYVQRYILLSTLFSALVWSLAAVLLFLYSPASRYALYTALILEVIRFFATFSATYETFKSQNYGLPSTLTLILMETLRYATLIRITMQLQRDPFVKAYWKLRRRKK